MSSNNLFRVLKNGSAYNALIPKSTCEKVSFGKGDTHFSIDIIVKQALQHTKQVDKLAQKLKAESGAGTLQEICYRVHQFLYWHLQYKADVEAQLLRSPACAWRQRKDGIDCKSYSIFASAILLQLGIKHYIRKIKQPTHNPEHYSHVYVIVPKNQDTGNLDKGYYTIDGTLQHITEPIYTYKKDYFMDTLPHFGLNGANKGLGEISTSDVTSLISGLDCIGGSAYDDVKLKRNVNLMNQIFAEYTSQINNAVKAQNYAELGKKIAEFTTFAKMLTKAYQLSKSAKSWNSCSIKNFDATIKVTKFYETVCAVALDIWVTKYFTKLNNNGSVIFTNNQDLTLGWENGTGFWGTSAGGYGSAKTTGNVFNYEPNSEQIPAFEINPYLLESTKSNSFDPTKYLETLNTLLITFNQDGSVATVYDQNNTGTIKPTTSQAGFGVLGWVLVLGGLGYAFTKMKDKGAGAKTTTRKK